MHHSVKTFRYSQTNQHITTNSVSQYYCILWLNYVHISDDITVVCYCCTISYDILFCVTLLNFVIRSFYFALLFVKNWKLCKFCTCILHIWLNSATTDYCKKQYKIIKYQKITKHDTSPLAVFCYRTLYVKSWQLTECFRHDNEWQAKLKIARQIK